MAVGLGAGVPWIMCNQVNAPEFIMLEFRVFNICNGTLPIQGKLPSTPGSSLTWFGFSEEGQLSSFDSKGVLRVFTNQYGGSWLPLFVKTASTTCLTILVIKFSCYVYGRQGTKL